MYADKEKRREYAREAMRKKRGYNKGDVTPEGVIPEDVIPSSHLERSWRSVARAQADGTLGAIVKGVVEKGHGGLVRWGCSGPTFQEIASVFFGGKNLPEDADVMGPMADEFTDEEMAAHAKVRNRQNVLVIARLPKSQQDELYRGLGRGE
ncbi:MAG: hypothetical protein M0R06_18545 [Sphaerochaeta sp.]|jgi:hypothetical protein|nr:hypothetical protein [Sphaerochaeta sp.]